MINRADVERLVEMLDRGYECNADVELAVENVARVLCVTEDEARDILVSGLDIEEAAADIEAAKVRAARMARGDESRGDESE